MEQGKLCSVQKRRIADRTVVSRPELWTDERRIGCSLRRPIRHALPRTLPATGMTKAVIRRREYPKRWRDRVQSAGGGEGRGMSGGNGGVLCRPGEGPGGKGPAESCRRRPTRSVF